MTTVFDIAPPTVAVGVELGLVINSSSDSGVDYDTVAEQFAKTLQQPEQRSLVKDISRLAKIVDKIKEAHQQIAFIFIAFEFANAEVLDMNGNPLRLAPQWRQYYERFRSIFEESRHSAVNAAACLKLYGMVMMENVDRSRYSELRAELQGFVQRLEQQVTEALKNKDDFARLATDLHDFNAEVGRTMQSAGTHVHDDNVGDIQRAVGNLADLINGIAAIWAYLRNDVLVLKEQLAVAVDIPMTRISERRIVRAREIYTILATLLDMYGKVSMDDN